MRIIAHLDMDAFFAAVEERDNASLKGQPIVVGADPRLGKGRGVVATANYPARAYGIRSAMPISHAWRLSQEAIRAGKREAVFLRGDYRRYSEVSAHIIEIIHLYSPHVEKASIDEAYFDLTKAGSFEKAREMIEVLKHEIKEKEQLTCSVGVGPNKLIGKIASDKQKPDGLTVVAKEIVEAFLEPLPIRVIPGIGPKTEARLHARDVAVVKDIKQFSRLDLKAMFGKWGDDLYDKVRGIDDSPIVEEYEAKSVGEQETFLEDTLKAEILIGALERLCASIMKRFAKHGFTSFQTLVLTVRFADFTTTTKTHTLKHSASDRKTLFVEALKLLMPFLDHRANPSSKPLRLIGVRVERMSRDC